MCVVLPPQPLTPTLFPYTTLFRSWRHRNRQTQAMVADLLGTTQQHLSQIEKGLRPLSIEQRRTIVAELGIPAEERSEEHTSELQSPCNIVCRLLLEKKTNKKCTKH